MWHYHYLFLIRLLMHGGVWLHTVLLMFLFLLFLDLKQMLKLIRTLTQCGCFASAGVFYLATHFAISLYSILDCFTFICFSAHVVVLHTFITHFFLLTSVWTPLLFFVSKVRTKFAVICRGKPFHDGLDTFLQFIFSLPFGLGVITLVAQRLWCNEKW